MRRLIDANKIDFKEVFVGASEFAQDTRNAAQMLIDEQPTAYDENKVIEELEKLSLKAKAKASSLFCEDDYFKNRQKQIVKQSNDMLAFAYDKAIEIVKRGSGNE